MPLNHTCADDLESLHLDRYLRKLAQREPDAWSPDRLQLAAREYARFLRLRQLHPETPLVPTELMDAVWHEHILNTRAYFEDMIRLFGRFLHHEPEYPGEPSDSDMQAGIAETTRLYLAAFSETPAEMVSARCNGKSCHAPSSCRCR